MQAVPGRIQQGERIMRPAWMDKTVDALEISFYKALENQGIAKKLVSQYPDQSIEELAETMAEGMFQGTCGDFARSICKDSKLSSFPALCKEAFKKAIICLLSEVK